MLSTIDSNPYERNWTRQVEMIRAAAIRHDAKRAAPPFDVVAGAGSRRGGDGIDGAVLAVRVAGTGAPVVPDCPKITEVDARARRLDSATDLPR